MKQKNPARILETTSRRTCREASNAFVVELLVKLLEEFLCEFQMNS